MYARFWEKNGRSGYSPAYDFNWNEFMAHKQKGGSIKDFENKKTLPLTREVTKKHLLGGHLVGVYPILPDNTSYFLAADFDGEHWLEDSQAFITTCNSVGLSAYLERSKSGNGGHVWLFFSEPYPCYKSRQIGLELIRRALKLSEFEKEVSFDRLFPNQDTLPSGGFGNLIALPFHGRYADLGNTLFIDPSTSKPYQDQWEFLKNIKRHSVQELDETLSRVDAQEISKANRGDLGKTLVINVGKMITLARSQLAPPIISFLKEKLNFLSSEYLTKKRLGKSVYKVQKYFKLVEEDGGDIHLPRGFIGQLIEFLESGGLKYKIVHEQPKFPEFKFDSQIKLSAEQNRILELALSQDQGVIVAPPGSGKTMIGMELIARRKLPALILVHRKQLLDQWVNRIQIYLNVPLLQIGRYSGTKKMVGREITVGLMQSLGRSKGLRSLCDSFGTIIIDECHHVPAKTFREVVSNFNPRYLYGLTATPKRKHNDEQLIFVYIGDIIGTLTQHDGDGGLDTDKTSRIPEVLIHDTELDIPFKWRTDHFQLLAKIISFDTARNLLIANDIIEQVALGNKILVLSERKEHLEILNLCLKGKCETIVISGDDSNPQRVIKTKQIQDGHYQVILSTGQFFGEGLDIKNISCLILAFPFSFEGKLIQYIGRLLHSANPKLVIDYRDSKVAFLERQYKQRRRYYKREMGMV